MDGLRGWPAAGLAVAALAAAAALAALLSWLLARPASAKPAAPFRVVSDAQWKALFAAHREGAFARLLAGDATRTVTLGACVATADPAALRALLLSRPHSLGRSWVYRVLATIMPSSDGILFMEGDAWRRRHSAFTPLLTGGNVRRYSLAMFESSLSALGEYAGGGGAPGRAHGHDLLTGLRAGASRFLLRFALGLQPHTPLGARLEADMDAYARTAFEVFPFVGPARQLAAYIYLWRTSARLAAGVRAVVAREAARASDRLDASNAAYEAAAAAAATPSPAVAGALPGPARPAAPAASTTTLLSRMLEAGAGAPATTAAASSSGNSGSGGGGGFSMSELVSEVNHLHGAHKAVAFVTSCMLAELSLPQPAAVAARSELRAELTRVCGAPSAARAGSGGSGECDGGSPAPQQRQQQLLAQAVAGHAAFGAAAAAAAGGAAALPPSSLPHGWRPPDRSDLEAGRLPVLSRVWRESLRHHVVSMGVLRRTAAAPAPLAAGGSGGGSGEGSGGDGDGHARIHGVPLPPGSDVLLLLHALHHDPALWGPDAEQWRPDRWLAIDAARAEARGGGGGGDARGVGVLPDPSQPLPFYPFLDGVRRCAGMHLAELEAAVMAYVWLVLGDVRVAVDGGGGSDGTDAAAAVAADPAAAAGDPTAGRVALERVAGDGGGPPRYKLRKRADMFASLDGRLPFTVARW